MRKCRKNGLINKTIHFVNINHYLCIWINLFNIFDKQYVTLNLTHNLSLSRSRSSKHKRIFRDNIKPCQYSLFLFSFYHNTLNVLYSQIINVYNLALSFEYFHVFNLLIVKLSCKASPNIC